MLGVVGYAAQWHLRPGEATTLHVSSRFGRYHTSCRRMRGAIHDGVDWHTRSEAVMLGCEGWRPGTEHALVTGSYLRIDIPPDEESVIAFSVRLRIRCLPSSRSTVAELLTAGGRLSIRQRTDGHLAIETGAGEGRRWSATTLLRLLPHEWHELAMVVNPGAGTFDVALRRHADGTTVADSGPCPTEHLTGLTTILIGGRSEGDRSGTVAGDFDGKVERPRLWRSVRGPAEALLAGTGGRVAAEWDLGALPYDDRAIPDVTGSLPAATLVNAPARAMTSSAWHGQSTDFRERPDLYAAAGLHRDDLGDAGWPEAFELRVPLGTPSGVYVVLLSAREEVDFDDLESFYPVAVFVAPPDGEGAEVALVLPTFSYRAYSNNIFYEDADPQIFLMRGRTRSRPFYDYAARTGLKSVYQTHPDGEGVSLATNLRPHVMTRPDHVSQLIGVPHQLSADLEIVQWLERQDVTYHVLADEQLHERGPGALAPYRVAVTGTHPEYASARLLDAYEGFIARGGSLMYLGGNGFILRVSIDEQRPELLELRRGDFGSIWSSAPGEGRHQADGEVGGLWRRIGRPPNLLTGLGFSAIGFSGDGVYVVPDGLDLDGLPEALRRVIEGIGSQPFGIAGLELDCYDVELGSPAAVTVLGELGSLPRQYEPTPEYVEELFPDPRAAIASGLRANLVLYRNRGGGLTFSVGSIRWASGLNLPGDPTRVAAITTAALRDLLSHGRAAAAS